MRKLKTFQLLTLLTGLCMIMTGTSCSSDEPQGGGFPAGGPVTFRRFRKERFQNQGASTGPFYPNPGGDRPALYTERLS